jgi:L-fuculose-phosphate aldolase
MSSTAAQARDAIVQAYVQLDREGLNRGSSGNVSVRDTDDGMLISPTGIDAARITSDGIVAIGLDGSARGDGIPSSEWQMHAEIYLAFPETKAIVHTHADACVALACQRRGIPAFHYMVAAYGGNDIRCAPYETFGSAALARAAVAALRERTACLLANHGMLARGPNLRAAVSTSIKLETLARHYWMTLQVGPPTLLSDAEMADVHVRYRDYGRARTQG